MSAASLRRMHAAELEGASRFADIELDDRARRIVARLETPMLLVGLVIVPAIIIDSAAKHGTPLGHVALALDWMVWLAFVVEFTIMMSVVSDRRRYLRHNWLDVVIIVATPPFLPVSSQLLRLLRLIRLVRVIQMAERVLSLEGLRYAALMAATTVVAGGFAFAAVERTPDQHLSAFDGLWWAVTTVTTVGYGDYSPKTPTGRLIGVAVMFAGIGFVALVTGAAAERFLAHGSAKRSTARSGHEGEVLDRLEHLAEALEETNRRLSRLEDNLPMSSSPTDPGEAPAG